MICDIYIRVSTLEQATEGFSLQEQEARLRAYAAAQGWQIKALHADPGFSGANLDRPGIRAVIEDAQAHRINKVVTYKLDRLSRSQKDTLHLIEDVFLANGVDYVSMTESLDTSTPLGMAMIGILSVFAQLEREQIAERMTMGRIASAKEGNWRGGSGVPIGYRYIPKTATEPGRLVVDAYEANIVRDVFRQFLAGKTYHAIYEHCRERYTTSYGSFAGGGANLIPAMLSNRAYIGEIKYSGQWYPGKQEPIIDRDTFDRAQARMAEYRAALDEHQRQPYRAQHLLSGMLFCGECGARWAYHSCSYKTKNGERRVYGTYTCYTKQAHKGQRKAERCSIPVWSASELEALVWEQVLSLQYAEAEQGENTQAAETKAVEAKIEAVERQRARLIDLYTVGTLPLDMLNRKAQELQEELEKNERHLTALNTARAGLSPDELVSILAQVESVRDGGDVGAQRSILQALIKRITLFPDKLVQIEWNI